MKIIRSSSEKLFFGLVLFQVIFLYWSALRPLAGRHDFRQAQTNWPVKIWLEEGFRPFAPSVPIKGVAQESWLLEFPLFQWLVYVVSQITSINSDYVARLIALSCAVSIVAIVAQILNKQFQNKYFLILFIFIFNPFFYYWSTTGLIDWLALFLGVAAGYLFVSNQSRKNNFIFLIVIFLMSLGSMTKMSHTFYGFALVYLLSIYTHKEHLTFSSISFKEKLNLILIFLASIFAFLIWSRSTSSLYDSKDSRSIWSVSPETFEWYFGTLSQYVNILGNLGIILQRFLSTTLPTLIFITILFFVLARSSKTFILFLVILLNLFYLAVFINLNVVHDYYQIPLTLFTATFLVLFLKYFFEFFKSNQINFLVAPLLGLTFVSFLTFSTDLGQQYFGAVISKSENVANCPSRNQIKGPIFVLRVEDPALFYHCNLKAFMVVEGRESDEANFANERFEYEFAFIPDPVELERNARFLEKFGGTLIDELEPGWYRINWN